MGDYRIGLTSNGIEHYRRDREEIDRAIQGVLDHGGFVMGPDVPAFEAEFAAHCEAGYAVAVTSGTSALLIALLAAGVEPGDEVIGVANADLAISLAAVHRNARLKWVDIEEDTFNVDPVKLGEALTPETRAVVIAHMYGLPADMDRIKDVMADYPEAVLIEDASLATGARYRGRRVGAIGDIGCFSLASTKVLGVLGSGGALTTDDPEYYRRINWVRHYGRTQTPYNYDDPLPPSSAPAGMVIPGLNERMDSLQAAVGRVKLRKLDADLHRRREIAALYDEILADAPCRLPVLPAGYTHCYRVYTITVDPGIRDAFAEEMRERGIDAGAHYVPPDHLHPYFRERGGHPGMLPVTEGMADALVCLPSHAYLTPEEANHVAVSARDILLRLAPGRI